MKSKSGKNFTLITGGTGFIGKRVVKQLIRQGYTPILLVRSRSVSKARTLLRSLGFENPAQNLVCGDITKKNLGLTKPEKHNLQTKISFLYHLAALYDTEAKLSHLSLVNCNGTKHILEFAKGITNLNHFSYISTAYVAGVRQGTIKENELIRPAYFRNNYEQSKFQAEQIVRQNMNRLPVVIFRPTIVVGDSQTGETEKFDGAYRLLKLINSGQLIAYIKNDQVCLDIIPVDFVAKAIVAFSSLPESTGKTFHLADPKPLTLSTFIQKSAQILGKTPPRLVIPYKLANLIVRILPIPVKYRGLLSLMMNYMKYDTVNTKKAAGKTNIIIPDAEEYLPRIIGFYQQAQAHHDQNQK